MPKIASSIMRQKITLQERTLTANDYGEMVESWADEAVLCGSFEPLKGQEYFSASQDRQRLPMTVAQVDARIRIRERAGINPADNRVCHGEVVYDIVAVIQDRERRQTQLMVRASALQQPDGSTVNA